MKSTELISAVVEGDLKTVKKILKTGRKTIDNKDEDGYTALHYAQEFECEDIMKTLLDNGANPNIQNNEGMTVLHIECLENDDNEELIYLLLRKNANPNIQDIHGNTTLINECMRDSIRNFVVNMLIKEGACVNIQNKDGYTALMYAVESRRKSTTEILLMNEANPNIQNKTGETALIIACIDPEPENDDDDDKSYNGSIFEHNEHIINILIERGTNVNLKTMYNQTALHNVIDNYKPSLNIIKKLYDYKASTKIKDWRNKTVEDYVVFFGYTEIERMLLVGL